MRNYLWVSQIRRKLLPRQIMRTLSANNPSSASLHHVSIDGVTCPSGSALKMAAGKTPAPRRGLRIYNARSLCVLFYVFFYISDFYLEYVWKILCAQQYGCAAAPHAWTGVRRSRSHPQFFLFGPPSWASSPAWQNHACTSQKVTM